VLAAGLLGSFLATPYLHPYDLAVLLVAAWLQLESASPLMIAWLLFGAVAAELVGAGIPYPVIVFELGWLGLLWLGADRASWPGRVAGARSSPRSG
ncbi:MAG TPA: hypothetical protein VK131_05760, partial [Candidatus Acidoferrales bacterium]|nr:hypothetical protein [Candidatus Acidoferrales bacterium]